MLVGADAPRIALPTCQSEVCSSFTRPSAQARRTGRRATAAVPVDAAGAEVGLGRAGRPGRERELEQQRDREAGLGDEHRARLEDRRPLALHGGQEPVLVAPGLGRVEPADDADRRVGDDPPLDLAGRLLGADQDDAEAAAALGDVEEDLLDRARRVPRARTCSARRARRTAAASRVPDASLASNAWRRTTPTTNRLARSCSMCRSTTVTWCGVEVDARGVGASAMSARMRCSTWRSAEARRRTNALIVPAPMARPVQRGSTARRDRPGSASTR